MAEDAHLFRTYSQLHQDGGVLSEMSWMLPDGSRWLPLYEAKMIHQFDHRWATYDAVGESNSVPADVKADRTFRAMPRYWVEECQVRNRLTSKGWGRGWLLGWRDITNATNERTMIANVVPLAATADTFLLQFPGAPPRLVACYVACLNSLVVDQHETKSRRGAS